MIYKIVKGLNIDDLTTKVKHYISEGYTPQGGVTLSTEDVEIDDIIVRQSRDCSTAIHYLQPMVKHN